MHLRRSRADEGERYGVLSRIAAFEMKRVVVAMYEDPVMLVGRESVMVLRMVVAVVEVGMQLGHCSRRADYGGK